MKKRARSVLKSHYWLFVLVCLFTSMIGVENTDVVERMRGALSVSVNVREDIVYSREVGLADIWHYVFENGEKDEGYGSGRFDHIGPVELGRVDGVFAKVINSVTSGTFVVNMFYAINSVVTQENVALVILLLIFFLTGSFVYFFIARVFMVISRRLFLESRTYSVVSVTRVTFLLRVRKWMHTGWVLLVTFFKLLLWWLTIVGGFIKSYAYILVPYIIAENPAVSAKEAIELSERMMYGRKWKLFGMHMSFIGWKLLGLITVGVTDVFYTVPYMSAFFGEFYSEVRTKAIEEGLSGSELLNDRYLYEYAPEQVLRATYADMLEKPTPVAPPKARSLFGAFCANVLGVVLKNSKREQAWCQYEEDRSARELAKSIVAHDTYPNRLFTLHVHNSLIKPERLHYIRHYSLSSIVIMFFVFAFIGWLWEVAIHLVEDGRFVNRGVLQGPWLPIYGAGSMMVLIVLNKFRKKPWLELIMTIVLCGVVEYFTSWYLEVRYDGTKWWDYTGYFININGRICAEGLLVFAIGGMSVVYVLGPLLDDQIQRIKLSVLIPICIALVTLFTADMIYSHYHPNTGTGITDYASGAKAAVNEISAIDIGNFL